VPLETVAPEETGEEMPGSAPAVPPAVPDLTAPPAGEGDGQEVGDELTDLLGGEDGKATEEPLGRAKKEGRVVMVAGKRIRLSEEQIKSLWQARIITETIRRRVEGNPVKAVTPEVVTEKSTVVVIGGHKVRLSEQQFKALVFAKNFRNIVESKGANVVKLSESQAKRLQYAKLVTERISKMLAEKKWIKTDPSEKGKYKGKTVADLEKMKSALEKKNASRADRGEKVPQEDRDKMSELNFALRAKRGHGFKEGVNEEKWIKTDPSERGKYKGKTIADLEKMKSDLEKQNANREERGEKVPQADREKMAELNFALRAKRGHGFKEDVAEGKAKRDVDAIMAKKRAKDASDDKPSNPMRDKLRKQIKSIKGEEVDENCGKKHGKKK
jgi:hypothetical protein